MKRMNRVMRMVLPAGVALACGCVPQDRPAVEGGASPADAGYQISVDATLLEEGKQTYERHCVGCHGAQGDGNGAAAKVLHPKPRNFQQANFKFSSRRSGALPTDRDLFNTITYGLQGTSMPGWKLLPERQRWALVAYIKTFSEFWKNPRPDPVIPFVEDPYAVSRDKSDAVARGKALYHGLAQCWTCHPAYVSTDEINEYFKQFEIPPRTTFREGLDQPVARLSGEGNVVFVPDFKRDYVRAGSDATTLYRSIAAGITGTAMPTWIDSIEIEGSDGELLATMDDLWAIAYYVQHLIAQRPPLLDEKVTIRDRAMDVGADTWRPVVAEQLRAQSGMFFGDEDVVEDEVVDEE